MGWRPKFAGARRGAKHHKLLFSKYNYPINIGNPVEYTINELVKIISQIIGCKNESNFLRLPVDDPKIRKPDITLAKKILNWEPKISLEEGLKITINYFRNIE